MQKLGLPVATTRLQMFHVADAGSSYKGGPEALGQSIFERGLRTISNDAAARQQLVDLVALLEEGLADAGGGAEGRQEDDARLSVCSRGCGARWHGSREQRQLLDHVGSRVPGGAVRQAVG
jgi:hypothetical protein